MSHNSESVPPTIPPIDPNLRAPENARAAMLRWLLIALVLGSMFVVTILLEQHIPQEYRNLHIWAVIIALVLSLLSFLFATLQWRALKEEKKRMGFLQLLREGVWQRGEILGVTADEGIDANTPIAPGMSVFFLLRVALVRVMEFDELLPLKFIKGRYLKIRVSENGKRRRLQVYTLDPKGERKKDSCWVLTLPHLNFALSETAIQGARPI